MFWGAVKPFTGIPTRASAPLGCPFLFTGFPHAPLDSFSLQRLPVFFSMSCGQMEGTMLRKTLLYLRLGSAPCLGICATPVRCGSFRRARRVSVSLETELFSKRWDSRGCRHRHLYSAVFRKDVSVGSSRGPLVFSYCRRKSARLDKAHCCREAHALTRQAREVGTGRLQRLNCQPSFVSGPQQSLLYHRSRFTSSQ